MVKCLNINVKYKYLCQSYSTSHLNQQPGLRNSVNERANPALQTHNPTFSLLIMASSASMDCERE